MLGIPKAELSANKNIFLEAIEPTEGIYSFLKQRPRVPVAQGSNFLPLTANLYEPLWRMRSLSIITMGEFSAERELKLMLDWLKVQPNQVILDSACSAGLYARTLLKQEPSLQVHALDFSLPFLKKAKDYAERDGLKLNEDIILTQADVTSLPYKAERFDAIVCGGSLNEFLKVRQVMEENARVLKPKGRMWQMYIKKSQGWFGKLIQASLRLSGIRFIDDKELEIMCADSGLKLIRAQHRGPVVMALFEKE